MRTRARERERERKRHREAERWEVIFQNINRFMNIYMYLASEIIMNIFIKYVFVCTELVSVCFVHTLFVRNVRRHSERSRGRARKREREREEGRVEKGRKCVLFLFFYGLGCMCLCMWIFVGWFPIIRKMDWTKAAKYYTPVSERRAHTHTVQSINIDIHRMFASSFFGASMKTWIYTQAYLILAWYPCHGWRHRHTRTSYKNNLSPIHIFK